MPKNRTYMRIIYSFLLAFIFCFQFGNAQQPTKKHQVKKGETVYQLSRVYNVSPKEILKLNPNAKDVIYVGDVLIIPSNSDNSRNNNQDSAVTQNQTITHHVLRGETKYGLSKKYGVTIANLEQQNPHIKNGLQAGHYLSIRTSESYSQQVQTNKNIIYRSHFVQKGETLYGLSKKYAVTIQAIQSANPQMGILKYGTTISIPSNDNLTEYSEETYPNKAETEDVIDVAKITNEVTDEAQTEDKGTPFEDEPEVNNNTNQFENYTIRPKETLYGLSKKANMSTTDFLKLNPQLEKSVQVGTVIKMPKLDNDPPTAISKTNVDKQEYISLIETIDKTSYKEVLFIMPFNDDEFNEHKNTSAGFKNTSDVIIKRNLEFYSGAKMAMDSLRKLGLLIKSDIIKIDTETSITPSNTKLKNSSLDNYQAIISPSYSNNIDWIASQAKNNDIPIVSAYNSSNNKNLSNIIEAYPAPEQQQLKMLDYLKSQNGNIVMISDYERENSRQFVVNNNPDISIIETKRNGNFSTRELTSLLDSSMKNFVIIDSDRNGVFLNTTNTLLRELSSFNIQLAVLDSELIPNEDDISSKRFKILKLLYPSISCISEDRKITQFNESYYLVYGIAPTKHVLYGYDITFDTLLRIAQKSGYNNNLDSIITTYLCLKFDYTKDASGRYVNNIISITEFNNDNITIQTD